jgi:acyl-CoA thioesterase-1
MNITSLTRAGLCLLLAATLEASCASPSAPTGNSAARPEPFTIVVLGDSLSVSPSSAESFPAVLQSKVAAVAPGSTVINAGVAGDTTLRGLRRFDAAIQGHPDVLVLELGANDGLTGVPIDTLEQNLSDMIERARAQGIQVLLCGMETPPLHGFDYSVDFHNVFSRLAGTYSLPLVPFLLDGVVLDPDLNLPDGIHPNAEGARRIADTVWRYLQPLLVRGIAPA